MVRQIGLDVPIPEGECQDKKCPFHSNLSVRGQVIEGEVISTSMIGSATVVRYGKRISGKFERWVRTKSQYHVHVPGCMEISVGDKIKFSECRKLSKTISHVAVERLNK
ncbi:MAG: 30S ribosomal protein S17 [Thermoplasmataceae archaeon]